MFNRIFLAGAATAFIASSAHAADIIEPTAYDWTGPYLGLQAGYGWGENDVKPTQPEVSEALLRSDSAGVFPERDGSIDIDGFLGGLHAGYNWQMDSLVLGVEGDIEYADLDGETDIVAGASDIKAGEASQQIDWLGSLRLRGGFAFDRALLYVTGGLAVGGVDVKGSIDNSFVPEDKSSSDTEWGWTLGGGLEYAFTEELSARIEYRYTDLGDSDVEFDGNGNVDKLEFENRFHAVRAGLSWHF